MKVEVTPELINLYHQGKCTKEENEAVIDWLLDPESTDELRLPDGESEVIHENNIWKGISKEIKTPVIPLHRTIAYTWHRSHYFKVACVACIVFLIGAFSVGTSYLTNLSGSEITFDNLNGENTKIGQIANLSLTLSPSSRAETTTSLWGSATQIRFCGSLEVTNNSGQDMELVFRSDCKNTSYTLQKVMVAKGKSYLAMHYHLNTDEIIVVDKANMLNLPPVLVTQFIKDFKLI